MLKVEGVFSHTVDDSYPHKTTGELIPQMTLVFLPGEGETETTKVSLDRRQLAGGAGQGWEQLKGKHVCIGVRIFDFKNGGYKILATGSGQPLPAQQQQSTKAA